MKSTNGKAASLLEPARGDFREKACETAGTVTLYSTLRQSQVMRKENGENECKIKRHRLRDRHRCAGQTDRWTHTRTQWSGMGEAGRYSTTFWKQGEKWEKSEKSESPCDPGDGSSAVLSDSWHKELQPGQTGICDSLPLKRWADPLKSSYYETRGRRTANHHTVLPVLTGDSEWGEPDRASRALLRAARTWTPQRYSESLKYHCVHSS